MGRSIEQTPGTNSDEVFSPAARFTHEARIQGRPDIYGIFLCERIGGGEACSPDFMPIDSKDDNGKLHHYSNPQQHLTAYSPSGYMVDMRWSEDYIAGEDADASWVQVASANLNPGVREPIKIWEVTGICNRLGRMTIMLEANDPPELHIAQPGERRRPRRTLSTMLEGYAEKQALRAYSQVTFDSDKGVLWVPPEGGIQQLRPVSELIDEVNRLAADGQAVKDDERLAQVISFRHREAA